MSTAKLPTVKMSTSKMPTVKMSTANTCSGHLMGAVRIESNEIYSHYQVRHFWRRHFWRRHFLSPHWNVALATISERTRTVASSKRKPKVQGCQIFLGTNTKTGRKCTSCPKIYQGLTINQMAIHIVYQHLPLQGPFKIYPKSAYWF
jgi:hypothetical protein